MNIEYIKDNGMDIAVVSSDGKVIVDTQSALDLAMTVKYETGAERIVIDKAVICGDFFILSTGMAGEILQKFMNYHVKVAVFGDYSHYTRKASLRKSFSSAYFWMGRGLAEAEPGPSTSMP